jgi:hypothetical protein
MVCAPSPPQLGRLCAAPVLFSHVMHFISSYIDIACISGHVVVVVVVCCCFCYIRKTTLTLTLPSPSLSALFQNTMRQEEERMNEERVKQLLQVKK